jgi:crotonobetainyl-CoA:carnitine CoA-transferase CaiB-like acyl-CoA transferase
MSPLSGIRIIDLSMGWAGPLACRHLADLGAEVIKVESCIRFDWWRSWEATPEWIDQDGAEKSTSFNMVNRNKRAITLELDQTEGKALLLRLVGHANAVVENFSGGVLKKLGLEYETLRAHNEQIVLLSMPPFGASGPWADFRAYGSTVEHASGLPHLNGQPEDLPVMQHVALGDPVGGIAGAQALLTALRHQRRTGQGQQIDLSQTEALFPLASHGILEFSATGREPARGRDRLNASIHQGVYPCQGHDEWLVIEITRPAEWTVFVETLNLPSHLSQPDTGPHHPDLRTYIADRTSLEGAASLMETLQRQGIAAARTFSYSDLLTDPHLAARNFWQWKDRAVVGRQPNPSAPYRFGAAPIPVNTPAPTLGEHNAEVLGGLLGLSADELSDLKARGIIGSRPRLG